MDLEIERSYNVNPERLPALDNVHFEDITQVYFSPQPADPRYPEVAHGEWRVRQKRDADGTHNYVATVKFGDKQSGSRIELETELEPGDFGTTDEDIKNYGHGIIGKRRYFLPDDVVLDRFIPERHGELWYAEREFASPEEAARWQPPAWADHNSRPASNRNLTHPLVPSHLPESAIDSVEKTLAHIQKLHSRQGKLLVTISGMSGSGKSTIAQTIAAELGADVINADNFHIGRTALLRQYGKVNHDLPGTYDYTAAASAAGRLLLGKTVAIPRYDFVTAEPSELVQKIIPGDEGIVVLDGLYAWRAAQEFTSLHPAQTQYNILVNTPVHVCVLRRLARDALAEALSGTQTRTVSMTGEETLRYIMHYAIPTYLKHQAEANLFQSIV